MERVDMEKLEKALVYVGRIADGKNPVNNLPAESDSVLNDPNVIRCMFYIKDILSAVKENNGVIGKTSSAHKKPFPLEVLSNYVFEEDKTITKLVEQLNNPVDENVYKKLTYKIITDWLKKNQYLQESHDDKVGKVVTLSTEKGNSVGISHSLQTNASGTPYYRIIYNRNAQEYIVKLLPEIIKSGNQE